MKRHGWLLTATFFLAIIPARAETTNDRGNIQGAWEVVWAEMAGKRTKPETTVFIIDGKRFCIQDKHKSSEGGLYLDETSLPKTADLVTSERTLEAIYTLDGDDLKICYDLAPEVKRPGQFLSNTGTLRVVMLLKRKKEITIAQIRSFRLLDGSKAFPSLVETNGTPPSPPKIAHVPMQTVEQELAALRRQVKILEQRLSAIEAKSNAGSAVKATALARVGEIIIMGNTKTPQDVILRQIPSLFPGGVIDERSLRLGEKNLAALNRFVVNPQKGIRPTIKVVGDGEFKEILVTVQEK